MGGIFECFLNHHNRAFSASKIKFARVVLRLLHLISDQMYYMRLTTLKNESRVRSCRILYIARNDCPSTRGQYVIRHQLSVRSTICRLFAIWQSSPLICNIQCKVKTIIFIEHYNIDTLYWQSIWISRYLKWFATESLA